MSKRRSPRLRGWPFTAMVVLVVACCAPAAERPIPLDPFLATLAASHFRCGSPATDRVSGLTQWHCEGAIDAVPTDVVVDGDDRGVFDVSFILRAELPLDRQRAAFSALVVSTGVAGSHQPELLAWIRDWAGNNATADFGRAYARLFGEDDLPVLTVSPGPRRLVDEPISG